MYRQSKNALEPKAWVQRKMDEEDVREKYFLLMRKLVAMNDVKKIKINLINHLLVHKTPLKKLPLKMLISDNLSS